MTTAAAFTDRWKLPTPDPVSPPDQDHETGTIVSPRDTGADASKIRFTLPMVAFLVGSIVSGMVSAGIGGWTFSSGLREAQSAMQSDLRDMRTRMEMQEKVATAEKRAETIEREAEKQSMDSLRGTVRLLELQMAEFNKKGR